MPVNRHDPYMLDLDHAQQGALKRVYPPQATEIYLTILHLQIFIRFARKDRSRDGLFESISNDNATMNLTEFGL